MTIEEAWALAIALGSLGMHPKICWGRQSKWSVKLVSPRFENRETAARLSEIVTTIAAGYLPVTRFLGNNTNQIEIYNHPCPHQETRQWPRQD